MKFFFLSLLFLSFMTLKSYSTIIQKVEVKNNNRISNETVITYGNIEIGKDYSQNRQEVHPELGQIPDLNNKLRNILNICAKTRSARYRRSA